MSVPQLTRRDALKLSAAGVLSASASGWFGALAVHAAAAAAQGKKHKSCILLFMGGGASHTHTFDMKPGGPYKAIASNVPGIQVSEYLPKMAQQMDKCAVLRSMSTGEASHQRAKYLMHTGYRQGAGGVTYPSLGSIVSNELGDGRAELPNFIAVGNSSFGAGYLGARLAPLVISNPDKGVENLKPVGELSHLDERAALLADFDKDLQVRLNSNPLDAHQKGYQRAVALMHSTKAKAFNLDEEPAALREAYGSSSFGKGCLLARRLVEAGVPFVEVGRGGWDTHGQGNAKQKNAIEGTDGSWAALLADLKDRGMLDDTLVIWMGEFGRTPDDGSNHYAKAWTTVLSGAGLKTGQVIGRTDDKGMTVEDQPISVVDYMTTICKALGINSEKEYETRGGRPMRLVDKGGKVVDQLFS